MRGSWAVCVVGFTGYYRYLDFRHDLDEQEREAFIFRDSARLKRTVVQMDAFVESAFTEPKQRYFIKYLSTPSELVGMRDVFTAWTPEDLSRTPNDVDFIKWLSSQNLLSWWLLVRQKHESVPYFMVRMWARAHRTHIDNLLASFNDEERYDDWARMIGSERSKRERHFKDLALITGRKVSV